jgi:ribosomal protein S18 acetylase RimI-like enzyme
MIRFLDGAGFLLAPRQLIERPVRQVPPPETGDVEEKAPPLVRKLDARDLPAVVRIVRALTGEDRIEYLERKFDEVLRESAIAVSLVAEDDGFPVAFAMARVNYGDFGQFEPTASMDTIGVSPRFAGRGLAQAILTQMLDNLAAIRVERLETEVRRDNFDLLRFLYRFGFAPSQRLPFEKAVL